MTAVSREASLRWYAIHTHAKQEQRAESNLLAWNVEAFTPRCLGRRRQQFRPQPSFFVKPLFPGYIFARFNAHAMLHKVRFTRGVRAVISVGDEPAPIEDVMIDIIRSKMDKDGLVRLEDNLREGDEVMVHGGHFSGFVGVFERRLKDAERVMILLKTINSQVRVIVAADDITKFTEKREPRKKFEKGVCDKR